MGANNSKNASYGNRHCASSGDGGCPADAVVWVETKQIAYWSVLSRNLCTKVYQLYFKMFESTKLFSNFIWFWQGRRRESRMLQEATRSFSLLWSGCVSRCYRRFFEEIWYWRNNLGVCDWSFATAARCRFQRRVQERDRSAQRGYFQSPRSGCGLS